MEHQQDRKLIENPFDVQLRLIKQHIDAKLQELTNQINARFEVLESVEPRAKTALLDSAEAMTELGIKSVNTLNKKITDGSLACVRSGGRLKFRQADLDLYIQRKTIRNASDSFLRPQVRTVRTKG